MSLADSTPIPYSAVAGRGLETLRHASPQLGTGVFVGVFIAVGVRVGVLVAVRVGVSVRGRTWLLLPAAGANACEASDPALPLPARAGETDIETRLAINRSKPANT